MRLDVVPDIGDNGAEAMLYEAKWKYENKKRYFLDPNTYTLFVVDLPLKQALVYLKINDSFSALFEDQRTNNLQLSLDGIMDEVFCGIARWENIVFSENEKDTLIRSLNLRLTELIKKEERKLDNDSIG